MSDRDLTPAQDETVRELLASAKHTDPAPPVVVARLDEALAELVSQRREVRAPVVTLASRRRRVASTALLAAAAVVVLGVGVTQVLPSLGGSESDSGASSAESLDDQTTQSERAFGAEEPAAGADTTEAERSQQGTEEKSPFSGPALDDPNALVSTSALKPQLRAELLGRASSSFSAGSTCPVPDAVAATQVPITYDGLPGVLVYRAPDAGRQQVEVYLCGEGEPLRSVQIRAR